MFGLTFDKLLIVGVLAVFLLGPDRLPGYASKLAQLVRTLRGMADTAKDRMRDEMGPEFDDVEWQKLDPRQYDPRRIIRDALLDAPPGSSSTGMSAATAAAVSVGLPQHERPTIVPLAVGEVAPYDSEAT
ncbi:Sec-independent protein translocase TatB [Frigoribacterium sp. 2-23]|uniref:Sec-independent protein translocase TatB n=1 Tax=Frigoribacterium sp. 2-23 TaxID=3415006 RepID=UPI003C706152